MKLVLKRTIAKLAELGEISREAGVTIEELEAMAMVFDYNKERVKDELSKLFKRGCNDN